MKNKGDRILMCQNLRNLIMSRLSSLDDTQDKERNTILNTLYDYFALKTFIRGLQGQLKTIFSSEIQPPTSLEQAM